MSWPGVTSASWGVDKVERVLVLNGPNLNLLGERDPKVYGSATLPDICRGVSELARELRVEVRFFQSNHEGAVIDVIHEERKRAQGIVINPGALTHYSYALHDALEAVGIPTVEVHLSDIYAREEWRRCSVIQPLVIACVVGKGPAGYLEALGRLVDHIRKPEGRPG